MNLIDQIILRFFQQKADDEDLRRLNQWSMEAKNQKELKDISRLWLWTSQMKEGKPSVSFDSTWDKITNKSNRPQNTRMLAINIVKYAAIILVVLNLGWWTSHYYYQAATVNQFGKLDVTADNVANSVIVLPDNTLVYLR